MHQRPPEDSYKYDLMAASAGHLDADDEIVIDRRDEGDGDEGDFLDDVFGGEGEDTQTSTAARHPSDMARLEQDHATAGYREGVTAGKAASMQASFDEGYALGAALGQAVGALLGVAEGVAAAASASADKKEVLARARAELTVQAVYGPAYFAPDGTWTYAVAADEPTVLDVARAHPLVERWQRLINAAADELGLAVDEGAVRAALGLEEEEEEKEEQREDGHSHVKHAKSDALDW